jgi:tetratricopeptide (TPR) repeat protein
MPSRRIYIILALVCLGVSPLSAIDESIALRPEPSASKASESDPTKKLIAQLGSDDFTKRRAAEAELIQLGAAAFDYLQDAQTDPDLEIATQAQYLLHRVAIDWARTSDPESVRDLMINYARVGGRERRELIGQLAALEHGGGLAALSRIAHFELSTSIAKHAALAVLNDRAEHQKSAGQIAKTITQEVGDSPRDSARWLRLYATQLGEAEKVDPAWLALIDEEISRLNDGSNYALVNRLMEFHIQLCKDLAEPTPLFETLRRRIDLVTKETHEKRPSLVQGLVWCFRNEQWAALELLETHYSQAIKADRLLLYLVAVARAVEGESAEATELAEHAYKHIGDDGNERNGMADVIAELGYHNWAEREWRYVIESSPLTSSQSMIARRSLANWCLHDRGDDKAAAELLAEVCTAVDGNEELKKEVLNDNERRYYLKVLRTQREYFTACYLQTQKDYAAQKKHLESAYHLDHEDPDVLIAMFRVKDADDEYRKRVEGRILRAIAGVEQRIESEPEEPTWYNHYAWLVSNTQGDFDKAVRYSLKSLELSPDTPSYLDTLGRCYFAAGDLENAIKSQRKAVELHPQVQVMHKQLEMFEKAQAEKFQAENGKQ